MDKDNGKNSTANIYANVDAIRGEAGHGTTDSITTRTQFPQRTVNEPMRNRSYRSVSVCLVVLCVLQLTAVIVLFVKPNLERDELVEKIINLTEDRHHLLAKSENLTSERDQLKQEKAELYMSLSTVDGWIYYKFSLYFISSQLLNWTESRRYCRERGADLIIINNKEEQDFVNKLSGTEYIWIGLSDSDEEGRWKWVDGSTLSYSFWMSGDPYFTNYRVDCIFSTTTGWILNTCSSYSKWICEKSISK